VLRLTAIHRQTRTDLRRVVAAVDGATEADRIGRLPALARWASGFARELHLHHMAEDRYVFPALLERLPDLEGPLGTMARDHDQVSVLMERWTPAVHRLADPAVPFGPARSTMLFLAVELRDLLVHHLDVEDSRVVPRIAEAFSPEEYAEITAQVRRSVPRTGLSFTVPWHIDALDPAVRARVLASEPWGVRAIYHLHVGRHRRLVATAFEGVPAERPAFDVADAA
jgi:hemerythrin-like domain-containing protein